MNYNIQQLIGQTDLRYNQHQNVEDRKAMLAEFAKMIVEECIDLCDDHSERKIRKHFGVDQ